MEQQLPTTDIEVLLEEAIKDPTIATELGKIDTLLVDMRGDTLITQDDQYLVDGTLTHYILDITTKEQALTQLKEQLELETDPAVTEKILTRVTSFIDTLGHVSRKQAPSPIVAPIETAVAAAPLELPIAEAPNPAEALASVQARLQESAVTPPVTRNASFDIKPVTPIAPAAPKVDVYREIPE